MEKRPPPCTSNFPPDMKGGTQGDVDQARRQGGGGQGGHGPPRKKLNFRKNKPPSPLHGRLVTGLCLWLQSVKDLNCGLVNICHNIQAKILEYFYK